MTFEQSDVAPSMRVRDDADQHRLATLYWIERVISNPIKWALCLSSAMLLSYWNWEGLRSTELVTLLAYAAQNALFTLLFARASFSLRVAKALVLASYAFDFLFVSFLIFGLGGSASQIGFLMYVTLTFKAGLYYPVFKESLLVLPIAIWLYLGLLIRQEGLGVFAEYAMKPRLFMLCAVAAITIYTAHLFQQRERQVIQLNNRLRDRTATLRRQAHELEAVIQGMHDGLLVIDAQHQILTLNPVSRTLLGVHAGARGPIALSSVEHGAEIQPIVSEALSASKATGLVEVLPPLSEDDDALRCYQVVASRIAGENGAADRVVMILRDITEQSQLEKAKSNFLSVVSHELRTPLSSIKGFLKIVLDGRAGSLNETQTDFVSTAYGQAEYLHVLVNDLVEFSRIQVRQTALDRGPVSLVEIARAICGRLKPLVDEKGLKLTLDLPRHLPEIDGDQLRLEQVVSNLVANAIKFTPDGGKIAVTGWLEGADVVLAVTDTGIGIPAEQREKIFEPFYQVSDGPSRLHGGMGLGLAICQHIVDRHGGRLEVDSLEGVGSTFRLVIPAQGEPGRITPFSLAFR